MEEPTGGTLRTRWRRVLWRFHALRLLPAAGPWALGCYGLTWAVGVVTPSLFPLATGALIASVTAAAAAGWTSATTGHAQVMLGLVAAVLIGQQLVAIMSSLMGALVKQRVDAHCQARVMRAALGPPTIVHLEDPKTLDDAELAGWAMGTVAVAVPALVGRYVAAGLACLVVARANHWVAVLVMLSVVVQRQYWRHRGLEVGRAWVTSAEPARRQAYFSGLLLAPGAEKETRIFDLATWAIDNQREPWYEAVKRVWAVYDGGLKDFRWAAPLLCLAYVLPYTALASDAATGGMDIGTFVAAITATTAALSQAGYVQDDAAIGQLTSAYPALQTLEEKAARACPTAAPQGQPDDPGCPEVRLEGVQFCYPGSTTPLYHGFDLTIRSGQSLAIVGANGAGKTSLIKLLTGMYEPSAGRIVVDGVDLVDLSPELWRRRLAVIFQDFARYSLSVADNIGFGAPERIGDREALARAASRAGILDVVESLPEGWDTPLSRQLSGGVDLSGGQWQRIALARALFAVEAGARVLVLDEPTAQLDVRAEADLFDRFFELTSGLTTIVVSHRFSTVRRADRIVVVDGGRVVEDGTHEGLLALEGRYATMFRIQAARFSGDTDLDDDEDGSA